MSASDAAPAGSPLDHAISRLLLVALLLAGAGPALGASPGSPAEARLARCERSRSSAGIRFECDGFAAMIQELRDVAVKQALELHVGMLRSIGPDVASSPWPFKVGGKAWEGVQFSVKGDDGAVRFAGRFVAASLPSGVSRVVTCGIRGPGSQKPCEEVLPLLASANLSAWKVAAGEPKFLGKRVAVPAGCEPRVATDSRLEIRCGDEAGLTTVRLASPADQGPVVDMLVEQLRANIPGVTEVAARDCRIGGVPARCRVIRTGGDKAGGLFLLGAAVVDGTAVSAMCAQGTEVKGVHPACAPVMEF
jgi:hypothetical protein